MGQIRVMDQINQQLSLPRIAGIVSFENDIDSCVEAVAELFDGERGTR